MQRADLIDTRKDTVRMQTRPDPIVIYHSADDGCWVAHSLETDQVGDGESVLEALECLMRGLDLLHKEAARDPSLRVWRKASTEIVTMYESAKPLPGEIFEIACKRVHGKWPSELSVNVDPPDSAGPYSTETRDVEQADLATA